MAEQCSECDNIAMFDVKTPSSSLAFCAKDWLKRKAEYDALSVPYRLQTIPPHGRAKIHYPAGRRKYWKRIQWAKPK